MDRQGRYTRSGLERASWNDMADPYCLAMVLCDGIHRDPGIGKFYILGTFSNFASTEFPAKIQFCTYFSITDGLGPIKLRLQLVSAAGEPVSALNDDDDSNRIFKVEIEQELVSPLVVLEGAFTVETILPAPGLYHCELWGNSEVLMSRRLTATLIPSDLAGKEKDG
jgi:hypothetical protein